MAATRGWLDSQGCPFTKIAVFPSRRRRSSCRRPLPPSLRQDTDSFHRGRPRPTYRPESYQSQVMHGKPLASRRGRGGSPALEDGGPDSPRAVAPSSSAATCVRSTRMTSPPMPSGRTSCVRTWIARFCRREERGEIEVVREDDVAATRPNWVGGSCQLGCQHPDAREYLRLRRPQGGVGCGYQGSGGRRLLIGVSPN